MLREFCFFFLQLKTCLSNFNLNDPLTTVLVQYASCPLNPLDSRFMAILFVASSEYIYYTYIQQWWIESVFLLTRLLSLIRYEVIRMILIFSSSSALLFRSLWQISLAGSSKRVIKDGSISHRISYSLSLWPISLWSLLCTVCNIFFLTFLSSIQKIILSLFWVYH